MGCIRLERIEPEANKRRYYLVTWARTLWDTWAVWRQWGRIGQEARGVRLRRSICGCGTVRGQVMDDIARPKDG